MKQGCLYYGEMSLGNSVMCYSLSRKLFVENMEHFTVGLINSVCSFEVSLTLR